MAAGQRLAVGFVQQLVRERGQREGVPDRQCRKSTIECLREKGEIEALRVLAGAKQRGVFDMRSNLRAVGNA